jgi:hypothetical protein
MTDRGPFQNERAACAAARAVIPPEPGWSILSQSQRAELLLCALSDAGVETSTFEYGTAWWLCGWEDHVTAIVARWIARAFEAGKAAGPVPAGFTEADVKPCRHCGEPLIPCRPGHKMPVCLGWKHAALLPRGLVGPHYCEGRSVNPSGEPKEEGA